MNKKFLELISSDLNLTIKTNRLIFEPIICSHAEKMLPLLSDAAIYTFIPQNPPTLEYLQKTYTRWQNRKSPDNSEIWLNWAAVNQSTNCYIGHFQAGWDTKNGFVFAYTVGCKFQKQGYAKEALVGMIEFLQHKMQATSIRAWIDTRNIASIALVKSLGFIQTEFIKDADEFKGSKSDEYVFELKTN